MNRELSPAYDEEARRLLEEVGLEDKIERCLGDIAVDGTGVTPADVVVLHRVVCCYPDYDRLLTAAAEHAKRLVVFSSPPRERNLPSRCDLAEPRLQAAAQGVPDVRSSPEPDARRV